MGLLPQALFGLAGLLVLSATAVIGGRRAPWVYPGCLALCLGLLGVDAMALASPPPPLVLPLGLTDQGMHFRLDALSGFFALVVNLGGAACSLYAIGYGRHDREPERILPFFPAFLAAMNGVLLADDAFTFLLAWEVMSLASWALVIADHRVAANRRAGYLYLLMANAGTLALLFAFAALAGSGGDMRFDHLRGLTRPDAMRALALGLTLIGAGSKAGMVPLHVWLPLAHPAAPSPVSALMSGVMTKVAIYGLIRILFDLCGAPPWWWAVPMLLIGSGSAVIGILYALMQSDLKKILAYSTIDNLGVIMVALGLAMAFKAVAMPAAAAVAMVAALLHVLNHSLFKALLFLGAGAVLRATGSGDIEQLGGLIHRLTWSAWLLLIGCAAAAALPPLNGFVSEWMLFQAILASPDMPQPLLRFLIPAVGGMLALAAALAASCFVRLFGITFLGRPRSDAAARAVETDRLSLAAMACLAALCVITGIAAAPIADHLAPLTLTLVNGALPSQLSGPAWLSLTPFTVAHSSYNAPILLGFMAMSASLTAWFIHAVASRRSLISPAWDCGRPDPESSTQSSASGFSQPMRRLFGALLFSAREEVTLPPPGDTAPALLALPIDDPAWNWVFTPLARSVWWCADRLNVLQYLTIRRYLSLTFLALILLLILVAIWQG